jgi:hypothetical protein
MPAKCKTTRDSEGSQRKGNCESEQQLGRQAKGLHGDFRLPVLTVRPCVDAVALRVSNGRSFANCSRHLAHGGERFVCLVAQGGLRRGGRCGKADRSLRCSVFLIAVCAVSIHAGRREAGA